MAVVLKHTKQCGYAWCGCCGNLNVSTRGEYLKKVRRKVKRSEKQAWKRGLRSE